MADAKMAKRAKNIYDDIIKMFDKMGWKYECDDNQLRIRTGMSTSKASGVEIVIYFKVEQERVNFNTTFPVVFPTDKKVAGAVAVCVANASTNTGTFNLFIENGAVKFISSISYKDDTKLSTAIFKECISSAAKEIDYYYDSFKGLADGTMAIADFLNQEGVSF